MVLKVFFLLLQEFRAAFPDIKKNAALQTNLRQKLRFGIQKTP